MSGEKKAKDRWNMSQQERDKQDTRTMVIALFIICPLIFIGFLVVGATSEYIWSNIGNEFVLNIGKLVILVIVGLVIFGIGVKVAKKIGIDK